ncbi:MAG: P83/100 family protein, partial [Brevinematia bacterium]
MRKILIVKVMIFVLTIKLFSQIVAEEELKSVRKVKFENYQGKYQSVGEDYLKEIGKKISDIESFNKLKTYNNYSIVRVKPKEDKLGADIIFISKKSKLKHINALRTIIAEYLSTKYNYTFENAYTIAIFATYYNAIYRGNIEYFKSKYSEELFKFTSKNIGISTKYYEWAGKTELVIPTKLGVDKEKPKLSEIGSKKVIEKIKDQLKIEERKEMLNIRKEELNKEKEEIKK